MEVLVIPGSYAGVGEAPQDGKYYVRRSGVWVESPGGGSTTKEEYVFDNTDLVGGVLTQAHTLGSRPAAITVYDPDDNVVEPAKKGTSSEVVLDFGGSISGTPWTLELL